MTTTAAATQFSLAVHSLTREYPTRGEPLRVLDGITLDLAPGDALAITGPSGSGKSTFLHIVGTIDKPTSGEVVINDQNPFMLSEPELAAFRNREIGFVFQDHYLLPQCSVLENVLLPTAVTADIEEDVEARARKLLDRVGLGDRLEHRPAELSGGQRQRVAVARALINRPSLLLCDEPTGNLDRKTAHAIGDLLLEIPKAENTTLIVVTHSTELAARFAKRMELVEGKLVPVT